MRCSWEMIVWRIQVNILQKSAKVAHRANRFLHLEAQLFDLVLLSLQLTIEEDKVAESLREVLEASFHVGGEYLLVVSVEFQAANNRLLGDVEHGNDQCTLGPLHCLEPIADILVFVPALLTQEDVRQRLLNVLEVEDDAVAFCEHQIDQVPLRVDDVL